MRDTGESNWPISHLVSLAQIKLAQTRTTQIAHWGLCVLSFTFSPTRSLDSGTMVRIIESKKKRWTQKAAFVLDSLVWPRYISSKKWWCQIFVAHLRRDTNDFLPFKKSYLICQICQLHLCYKLTGLSLLWQVGFLLVSQNQSSFLCRPVFLARLPTVFILGPSAKQSANFRDLVRFDKYVQLFLCGEISGGGGGWG